MEAGTNDPVETPQKRSAYFKRLAVDIRKQLEDERVGGPPTQAGLQAALEQAEADLQRREAKIKEAKQQSKKRKREIGEWKTWYNNQADIDQTAAWAKLDSEIDWRAAEIDVLQTKIGPLVIDNVEAQGRVIQVQTQLAALEAGVHDRPVEEDPRLVSVMQEWEAAKAAVKKSSPPRKKRRN